jgi:hypothetical protein
MDEVEHRLGHDVPAVLGRQGMPVPGDPGELGDAERQQPGTGIFAHLNHPVGQDCRKVSRSALIVSAWVVGIPCGNPRYVFSVPFCTSCAESGPESA